MIKFFWETEKYKSRLLYELIYTMCRDAVWLYMTIRKRFFPREHVWLDAHDLLTL